MVISWSRPSTTSTDLPAANAPQIANAGGQDGYVFRMSGGLDDLTWATFLGGSGDDAAYSLCINGADEVIVTGGTTSSDLPMNGTPFNAVFGAVADAFVGRYSPAGDVLLSSTYLGTSGYDQGYFVQVDPSDSIVVLGQSEGNYPVVAAAYSNGNSTNFLQKLGPDLSTGSWSTVIGNSSGSTDISPIAFGISATGRLMLCGWGGIVNSFAEADNSTTNGLMVTPDAYQLTTNGNDLYIAVLDPGASALHYATFLGGPLSSEHVEGASSTFDINGDLYLTVCAGCGGNDDFPTTPGAWSATNNNDFNCNLAAVKFMTDGTTGMSAPLHENGTWLWPSVTSDRLNVSGCADPPCMLTVMDAIGRLVEKKQLRSAASELRVDHLPAGLYNVRMGEGSEVKEGRFVVPTR
jgi:hypothetical protein